MIPLRADIRSLTGEGYFGPANILDFCDGKYRVKICPGSHDSDETQVWATSAIALPCKLQWGDTILLAGDDLASLYIIGIIDIRVNERSLMLEDGTNAVTQNKKGSEKLAVFSNKGELLFEYNAGTKKSSVHVQEGDIEFIAQNGHIDFTASRGIRFFSENPIEIKSLKNIKLAARKLETIVESIMEKAKNVYRTVEKLTQLKTGKMRTLVEGTSHVKTRKAFYKAEEDFKIKGKKIHLG